MVRIYISLETKRLVETQHCFGTEIHVNSQSGRDLLPVQAIGEANKHETT